MPKPQISTTVGPYVRQLFDELCKVYSSGSVVLTLAIRDLHAKQFGQLSDEEAIKRGATNVLCVECGEFVDPDSGWIAGSAESVFCAKCAQMDAEEAQPSPTA